MATTRWLPTVPGKTWYLAAGASVAGFDTWLLIENPGSAPATVKVSFMTDAGTIVNQPLFVLPHSRTSLYTDPLVPNAAYGMRVDSDQPIVAERAVYFDSGRAGLRRRLPSRRRRPSGFCPKAAPRGSFEEQLAVLNPQNQPVNVQVDFRPQDGDPPPPQRFSVGPTSRLTLDVNPSVQDANVALHVTSDRPIVVERVSYFARADGAGRNQLDRADSLDVVRPRSTRGRCWARPSRPTGRTWRSTWSRRSTVGRP